MRTLLLRYSPSTLKPADIIAGLISIVFPDGESALDLTPGRGNFWSEQSLLTVTDSPHDFRSLPYEDQSFDIVVFDPPHNADAGHRAVMRHFGTYPNGQLETVIRQGCREAWRVAKLGTICKVTDQIHGQKFVRESGWVYDELGEPFEVVHGQRQQVEDPKWKMPALSARSNGSTYIVHRRGDQKHTRRGPKPSPALL